MKKISFISIFTFAILLLMANQFPIPTQASIEPDTIQKSNSGIIEDANVDFALSYSSKLPIRYCVIREDKKYYLTNNYSLGSLYFDESNVDKYLILGNDYDFSKFIDTSGFFTSTIKYTSSNTDVLTISENGIIHTIANGNATIAASLADYRISYEFTVTDLIVQMPKEFNPDKELLPSERYNQEENDLLDEILEYRVNKAGYKTRGGVVAATRFLLLEFPYRLTYFYEYGRQGYNHVDGEGRYYLKGLYLDESRFERLIGSNTGPATWGSKLYSVILQQNAINGLDCSGFVTWVLLNAGYDCGDIGSGFSAYYNLTNTGELVDNNLNNIAKAKAGDLVHSNYMGGHIGIVAGLTDKNVYIAQATPKNNWGVTITKYTYEEFIKDWNEIVLMDSYYQEEGNYTNMWQ